jgi:hypothetical protein
MINKLILIIIFLVSSLLFAQESGDDKEGKKEGGFGGPDQVDRQMNRKNHYLNLASSNHTSILRAT